MVAISKDDLLSDGVCPTHACPNHFLYLDCKVLACGTCTVLKHKTCQYSTVSEGLKVLKEKYFTEVIKKRRKDQQDLDKMYDLSIQLIKEEIENNCLQKSKIFKSENYS